ncbi:hypothetical protein AVO45_10965 [Ruegeria marisrubri]|uniref:Carbohydrate kinase PfkB domain-containing protein n=1 Tax=Ruegeria marisrubri TaxID=1685379 RepID=A0A0X3TRB2_9RHOB|nr:carbohydrate kinase [Ruegeria marisrubri]KUJ76996.1 hypothetical protein AVO45_10965 [Ruegeria marisrubri]
MAGLTPPAILCCGEAVMDFVPSPLADGEQGFRPVPGGAAVNTAVALSRLGVASGFVGALSTDPMGKRLSAWLAAEGVDTRHAVELDAPSTIALAHPLPDGNRFDLYDEGSAGRSLTSDRIPALPGTTKALVFGGISLIHAPSADVFEGLARRAKGTQIWLDLNIRPGLVTAPDEYRARLDRMMALAHVIKVSDEDLNWLGDMPVTDPAQVLIHTQGASGAAAHAGELSIASPAPKVEVRDTVGAGDVFNAGFLAYLHRNDLLAAPLALTHESLAAALAAGNRAASLSVTRPGADAPTLKEVECAP